MGYLVRLSRASQKNLDNLRGRDYESVFDAVLSLGNEPRPDGVKKLRDSGLWRVRVGKYRIVYTVDDRAKKVIVARVARRSEGTYRGI